MEIYGASGSGKSEVLINVVAQYILPAWLGGEEQTAVYFDNGELLRSRPKPRSLSHGTVHNPARTCGGEILTAWIQ